MALCVPNLMVKFHFQALILLRMSLWGQLYLRLAKLNKVGIVEEEHYETSSVKCYYIKHSI